MDDLPDKIWVGPKYYYVATDTVNPPVLFNGLTPYLLSTAERERAERAFELLREMEVMMRRPGKKPCGKIVELLAELDDE